MPQIVLQPCSDPQAQANLKKTMLQQISSQTILDQATDMDLSCRSYFERHPAVTIWGVKEKQGRPKVQWERMKKGDLVLFYAAGSFILIGTVDFKFTSPKLADYLWHEDGVSPEFSYKFLYVIKNPIPLYTDSFKSLSGGIASGPLFRKAQVGGEGLRDDGVVMGITVVSDSGAQKLISSSPTLQNYQQSFSGKRQKRIDFTDPKLEEQLEGLISTGLLKAGDVLRISKYRIEQGELRESMIRGREIVSCCICGEEFPATSIVTAHIKKRSRCSPSEMRDTNVVAPMCYLGCDHLFEHGYIVVGSDGIVKINREAKASGLKTRIKAVSGLSCLGINNNNTKYYAWHRKFHSQMIII
ncbi:hypothetical protein [uncultured Deinococcus sp.]|uniref:hypothetical protein n=1 Tax=uncultured Deinococcus sp. TaxID=158789 RepID=UPI00258677EC|nr:hypothetical protein [uncultured Deinococcus sp.]